MKLTRCVRHFRYSRILIAFQNVVIKDNFCETLCTTLILGKLVLILSSQIEERYKEGVKDVVDNLIDFLINDVHFDDGFKKKM